MKKHIWCSIMIVLIIAFDQVTKMLAKNALYPDKSARFIDGFVQFRYCENTGMAFSLGSGGRWVFVALSIVVIAGALYYLFSNKCKSLWEYWSIGVVIAGGLGNLIDRVFNGYVIDMIEPLFVDFAVFNIADCAVTLGACSFVLYLICDLIRDSRKKGEKDE